MKPAAFRYHCPNKLSEVLELLGTLEDTTLLAGGQSLVPLLNLRMAQPEDLIDLNRVEELQGITADGDKLYLGAMVRHQEIERNATIRTNVPVLSEAMHYVAHLQIKSRGTIGGNLCNAHPSSEMPAVLTALGATFVCQSAERGIRKIAPPDLFVGALENSLEEDEILTEIQIPLPKPDVLWAFHEVSRRDGDFAMGGAAVLMEVTDSKVTSARIALCGVGDGPYTPTELEQWMVGQPADLDLPSRLEAQSLLLIEAESDSQLSKENRVPLLAAVIARTAKKALNRKDSNAEMENLT